MTGMQISPNKCVPGPGTLLEAGALENFVRSQCLLQRDVHGRQNVLKFALIFAFFSLYCLIAADFFYYWLFL